MRIPHLNGWWTVTFEVRNSCRTHVVCVELEYTHTYTKILEWLTVMSQEVDVWDVLSRSCVSLKGLAGSGSEPTKVNGTVHAELLHFTRQDSVVFFLLFHIL